MPNSNRPTTNEVLAARLILLAATFNEVSSVDDLAAVDTILETVNALRSLETNNRELQQAANNSKNALRIQTEALREEQRKNAVLQRAAAQTPQGKPLAVFVSSSDGMRNTTLSDGRTSPIEAVLKATLEFSKGANLRAEFWGNRVLSPVPIKADTDISKLIERSPFTGIRFEPVVDFMEFRASSEPDNFVIISNGDFNGRGNVLSRTLEVLEKYPATTIDFVLTTTRTTEMERFAQKLIRACPNPRQIAIIHADTTKDMTTALKDIAKHRIGQPETPAVRPAGRAAPEYHHG